MPFRTGKLINNVSKRSHKILWPNNLYLEGLFREQFLDSSSLVHLCH
jgi:hypothetical protein